MTARNYSAPVLAAITQTGQAHVTDVTVLAAVTIVSANFARLDSAAVLVAFRPFPVQSFARIEPGVNLPCLTSEPGQCYINANAR
jgi:hypothetical protein